MPRRAPVTDIYTGQRARQRILEGALELAQAVAVTYGPRGGHVLMDRPSGHIVTKDGVSVAYEVQHDDDLKRIGARTLLQACTRVRDLAGDGTTTTAILAAAILRNAHKSVSAGVDPGAFAAGLRAAVNHLKGYLADYAVSVTSEDKLTQVALVSSNDDLEVSQAISRACMLVGKTGTISVENGRGVGIEVEHRPGFEWDCGPDSPELGAPDGSERRLDVCLVALVPDYLESFEDVQSILEEGSQWPHPIVIVARRCIGTALSTLVRNQRENEAIECVSVMASRAPQDFHDNLRDLAALTGATIADPAAGRDYKRWNPEWFGTVQSAEIRRDSTSLVSFENDETDDRIMARLHELECRRDTTEFDHDRDKLVQRIAKLSGGFCVMKVGGLTEIARKERRGRIEDCLGSVRAALKEGVVPGGGTIYMRLQEILAMDVLPENLPEAHIPGWKALEIALESPLRAIARNAGAKPDIVCDRLYRDADADDPNILWYGWDARLREVRSFMDEPMIADPLPQVRAVLESAVSVVSTLLTVETAVVRRAIRSGR